MTISSVQSLSCVRLFATPWIAASQASLSITNSQSSLTSICPSSHLILCRPLLLPTIPASKSFPMSQLFAWGGQSTGVSALASFLPKKSQGWSSERTGWISLQSKGLSRVFSNTTVQKHQFFSAHLSLWSNSHIHTCLLEKRKLWPDGPLSAKQCLHFFNMLSRLVIGWSRSKCLLISWLQSPSAVISEPKKIKSVTVSTFSPSICHEVMGLDAMIFVFWILSFKPAFSLSSFTFVKKFLVPRYFLPLLWARLFQQLISLLPYCLSAVHSLC